MSEAKQALPWKVLELLDMEIPCAERNQIERQNAERIALLAYSEGALAGIRAALEMIAQLADAKNGRHFAAIATSQEEHDKRRHGIKSACMHEFSTAIRSLPEPPLLDKVLGGPDER